MALQTMTVCETTGTEFPYEFNAKKDPNDATEESKIVKLVMPFGGKETGFYRYPKVGENILVDDDGMTNPSYYLIGYLPSATDEGNNFLTKKSGDDGYATEKNALASEEGMVLRYRQTGKGTPSATDVTDRYSEIGFYHRPTQWKVSQTDKSNYSKFSEGNADIPKIDQLNIQSTGDIHTKAKNHQRLKAKRIEILSDVDESDFSKELKDENRPFGDRDGDDSFLYAGDAHIRAKNRIVIKAGESIELQAGRSSIIINDEGVIIASRKTQSNIYNSWDTVMALKASKGLTMFGQHVTIRGGIDYTLSEGYGGSISSKLGVMRLAGFDIRAETLNTFNYLARGIGNGVDFLANAGTMIAGSAGANSSIGKNTGSLSTNPALNFFASKGSSEVAGGVDFQGTITGLLDTILSILMIVEIALEQLIPKVHKRDKHGRDGLYTALALAEYGVILASFYELCTPSMPYAIFEASLHLTSKSFVLVDGLDVIQSSEHTAQINSPLAGISSKTAKEAYKEGFTHFKDKLLKKLSENKIAIGVVAVIGIGAVVGLGFAYNEASKQNKELEDQLRSL